MHGEAVLTTVIYFHTSDLWERVSASEVLEANSNLSTMEKVQENTPRQKRFDEKKIKIAKENTDVNKSSNQRKCTKSDQRN